MQKIKTRIIVIAVLIISSYKSHAQLNPLGAMYFQNQYLANPAFAGMENELNIGGIYRQQWSNIPGAPSLQSLTADWGSSKRMGLGVSLNNDHSGLMRRTRAVASYAYHLPLSGNNDRLSFGLSLGVMDQRINYRDVDGDLTDVSIANYNNQGTYLDGDFGLAYTGNRLRVQAALPNLKSFFNTDDNSRNEIDRATWMGAASYRLTLDKNTVGGMELEPKVVVRGVKNYDAIIDAGANLSFLNNTLNFQAMYHSTKNASFGVGMNFKKRLSILGLYSSNTSAMTNVSNGTFEIGLRVKAF
ncbi:type IX secretion system membrane protein PorP/SprF [Pedobacter sp. HMF7647]|uniref:Type IX secretion system membrane protein PorP/SprF n=1 Tax=Hufsiella arboris TaxID=2695275 RepID=A0A7K1YBT5_9SPHI|nr:PorP/SprF family type IX secretion system membrane protein [Hufsiella arboris]MXV51498.1 type IX secretion system membrane protein PorP/SprF [Hufsiella arboris]